MTRKHFEAIAAQIRLSVKNVRNPGERSVVVVLTLNLCDEFEKFNPNFNRGVFLDACGLL